MAWTPNPADFGATNIVRRPNEHGGWHWTAYSPQAGQISWDNYRNGRYVDGSLHLSERNIPGGTRSWGS